MSLSSSVKCVTIQEIALFLIGALLLISLLGLWLMFQFFYPIQQELPAPMHLSVIDYKYHLGVLVEVVVVVVVVVVQDK